MRASIVRGPLLSLCLCGVQPWACHVHCSVSVSGMTGHHFDHFHDFVTMSDLKDCLKVVVRRHGPFIIIQATTEDYTPIFLLAISLAMFFPTQERALTTLPLSARGRKGKALLRQLDEPCRVFELDLSQRRVRAWMERPLYRPSFHLSTCSLSCPTAHVG